MRRPLRAPRELEDLLGGRLLALVGGRGDGLPGGGSRFPGRHPRLAPLAGVGGGCLGLTLAQVAACALGDPPDARLVIVLAAFAALNLAVALGYELRDATATLVPSSALLVPFGALVLGALGYFGLPHGVGELAGGLWLVGLAVIHTALAGLAFACPG